MQHDPYAERVNEAAKLVQIRREKLHSAQDGFIEGRIAFYDKLALFDGATIALSVSFINVVTTHQQSALWRELLIGSWVVLAVSMALAVARNSLAQRYVFHAHNRSVLEAEIGRIDADIAFTRSHPGGVVYRDSPEPFDVEREIEIAKRNKAKYENALTDAKRREKWADRFHRWLGIAALLSSVAGLGLLIAFAARNIYR